MRGFESPLKLGEPLQDQATESALTIEHAIGFTSLLHGRGPGAGHPSIAKFSKRFVFCGRCIPYAIYGPAPAGDFASRIAPGLLVVSRAAGPPLVPTQAGGTRRKMRAPCTVAPRLRTAKCMTPARNPKRQCSWAVIGPQHAFGKRSRTSATWRAADIGLAMLWTRTRPEADVGVRPLQCRSASDQ
jgi:hypothetical protein